MIQLDIYLSLKIYMGLKLLSMTTNEITMFEMFSVQKEQADKLSSEEISKEEYDNWRYHYPKFDTTQRWAKVPSQALSDALVEAFKDQHSNK